MYNKYAFCWNDLTLTEYFNALLHVELKRNFHSWGSGFLSSIYISIQFMKNNNYGHGLRVYTLSVHKSFYFILLMVIINRDFPEQWSFICFLFHSTSQLHSWLILPVIFPGKWMAPDCLPRWSLGRQTDLPFSGLPHKMCYSSLSPFFILLHFCHSFVFPWFNIYWMGTSNRSR